MKPQRHRRGRLLAVVPDLPAADTYVPPSAAQRAAAQDYMRGEPIVDPELESAMADVEQNLRPIELAQIELARLKGEQSPSWETMSRALAVNLARRMAKPQEID